MDRGEAKGALRQGTRRTKEGVRGAQREAGRAARDPQRARRDAADGGRRLEQNAEQHPAAAAAGAATGAAGGAVMGGPVGAIVGAVLGAARGLIAADAIDALRRGTRQGSPRHEAVGGPSGGRRRERGSVPDRARVVAAAGGDPQALEAQREGVTVDPDH